MRKKIEKKKYGGESEKKLKIRKQKIVRTNF